MLSRSVLLVVAVGWAVADTAGSEMVARIRLDDALRSNGIAPGHPFRATVVSPLVSGERILMPAGTIVHGIVENARQVGLGFVRERAWLQLGFHEYELADGRKFPMSARLRAIDNAREEVTLKGRIRGVVAASHAYSFIQGIWYQPQPSRLLRSVAGLTGASGKIWSRYSLGPMGAAGLFALRFSAFRLPEPEIALPAGTEMQIELFSMPADPPWLAAPPADPQAAAFGARLSERPFAVMKPGGMPADDIINLAFIGTRQQVETAFLSAGWVPADPLTPGSFARAYHAFTTMEGYPAAPVSLLVHEGGPPSMVFQKALNTLAKRHHVRIWQAPEFPDGDVWVGAATHDVGLAFDRRAMSFTHRIDLAVDRERSQVIDDLTFAGCSAPAAYVDRCPAERARGQGIITDGRLGVVRLLPCTAGAQQAGTMELRSRRKLAARITRRVMLETRHYLVRGNVYYWAFRGLWRRRSGEELGR